MIYYLDADMVSLDRVEGAAVVGFIAGGGKGGRYFMLQRSKDTQQDVSLGMATYYVEIDGQHRSCYGGISRVELGRGTALFTFLPEATGKLGGVTAVEVRFELSNEKHKSLQEQLAEVLRGTALL